MGRRWRDRSLPPDGAMVDAPAPAAGPDDGRSWPTLTAELDLARAGHQAVAGLDEVGRGAVAGPLVAAAVVLPAVGDEPAAAQLLSDLAGVRDSKRLTPNERRYWLAQIQAVARGIGRAIVPEGVIDALGVGAANRLALRLALADLPLTPDYALIDACLLPGLACAQTAVVRGDSRCLSIAAASIVAKVTRDELLDRLAVRYPVYGFDRHKGYGTADHLAALTAHGPCTLHRRGFAPIKGWCAGLLPAPVART